MMKRAEQRTDYVLVKLQTNTEWDNCAFAVIKIIDSWLQQMRDRLFMLLRFWEDSSFDGLVYSDSLEGYCNSSDTWNELLKQDEVWAFVQLDDKELRQLLTPENALDIHQLVLDRYGNAHFKAYGKYSREEFYTENFSVAELISRCGLYKSKGTDTKKR